MNKIFLLLLPLATLLAPSVSAQRVNTDFQVKKVSVEFIKTPEYQFQGSTKRSEISQWMEVETEFEVVPEFTEELTFTYYVQISKLLFVGSVTHVSIPKGKGLYSVMYISPRSLNRIMDGKILTATAIERVSVEISKQGQLLAFGSWKDEKPNWWTSMPQKTGFLLNKSETPFAPLYWDRYEAIKSAAR